MPWQITSLLFSAVFALMMLLVIRGRLRTIAAAPFCLGLLLKALWALNYAIDLGSPDFADKLFLLKLRSSFLAFYMLVWAETAFRMVHGRPFFRGWNLAAGAMVPMVTALLLWVPGPAGALVQHSFWLDDSAPVAVVRFSWGPWGQVFNAYVAFLVLATVVLIFRSRLHSLWERRARLLFIMAAAIGFTANTLYTLNLSSPAGLNYTPILFPLTSTLLAWALLGNRVLELAPVARAALIERLEDRLVVIDGDSRVIDFNQAAVDTLGLSRKHAPGRPVAEVLQRWPELLAQVNARPGAAVEIEIGPLTFEYSVFAIQAQDKTAPLARILSLRDVTRRKQSENQLRLAKEAAERADQAQARFLATMSHEIRTPMNGVLGFTQLLAASPLSPEQRDYLDLIDQSGRSLLVIVNDVLDYSKIVAGQLNIEHVPCDPAAIAVQVCRQFGQVAADKGLVLTHTFADNLPTTVLSDPVRIGQILTNLVGNALKFTSTGGVSVHLGLEADGNGPDECLRLSVRDSGIGITPEQQTRIFQAFSQADTSITRRFGGTGLGLTITRRLCELMHGALTLESTPGQGSLFTAKLRVGRTTADPAASPATPDPEALSPRPEGLSVLVCEDNLVNQALLRAMLTRLGHQAHFVGDGEQALAALKQSTYDVVLMDIEMPVMDGYTTVRQIRDTEAGTGARQYIIAVTAHALKGEFERCLSVGMDDFLTKPLALDALANALARRPATAAG